MYAFLTNCPDSLGKLIWAYPLVTKSPHLSNPFILNINFGHLVTYMQEAKKSKPRLKVAFPLTASQKCDYPSVSLLK
jgi:hypothetical protein